MTSIKLIFYFKKSLKILILNFEELIADLESERKIGPEGSQRRIGHTAILAIPMR